MLSDGLQFLAGAVNTNFSLPFTNNLSTVVNATRGDLVYNTGINPGLYIHDGAKWVLGLDLGPQTATPDAEVTTNKGIAGGYAALDTNSLLLTANLPAFTGDVTSNAGSNTLSLNAIPWSKLSDKPTTLSNYGIIETDDLLVGLMNSKVSKSGVALAAGTAIKVTFNSNGLITAAGSLALSDIPDLPWNKITTGKPTALTGYGITEADPLLMAISNSKINKPSTALTPTTATKISFNENGLVTSSGSLSANDIPIIPWSKLNNTPTLLTNYGISEADPLLMALYNAKVQKSGVMLTAGTASKVTFNASGLITASSPLTVSDLPAGALTTTSDLNWDKITNHPTTLAGYGIIETDTILTAITDLITGVNGGSSAITADPTIKIVRVNGDNYNITVADNGKLLQVNDEVNRSVMVPDVGVLTMGKNFTVYNQSPSYITNVVIPVGYTVRQSGDATIKIAGANGGKIIVAPFCKVTLLFTSEDGTSTGPTSAVNQIIVDGIFDTAPLT